MPRQPFIRRQLYLPEHQMQFLQDRSARTGTTVSELIRRAIDRYIEDIGANGAQPTKKGVRR